MINLHVHSSHSLLDGFSQIDDIASISKQYEMSHVALTDHGNMDGAIKFAKSCKNNGIKPIFGCEFYIVEDAEIKEKKESRSHLIALAKNKIGLENIMKMITISNVDNFFYRPRIDPKILLSHCEGVIISTACSASFIQHEWGQILFEKLYNLNKEDLYLEIMPHLLKDQIKINEVCLDMKERYNVKLIATCDSHYINKEDSKSQEVMLAIQSKKKWTDPDRWKFDGDSFYFMSEREMTMAFVKQGQIDREIFREAMDNTEEIAEKIDFFDIEQKEVNLPKISSVEGNDFEFLKDLCKKEFANKIKNNQDIRPEKVQNIYIPRLEEELNLIKEKKFERYFLMVWDLIKWCNENDIMTGPGRGSGSSSLVCYLLGITHVDPIEYNLLFFRFISPDRQDLPDIDIDFEDVKRPLVKKHLEDLYGKWNVAGISTFSVMRGKGALRDVSRVFDIPLSDVNKACSVIETKLDGEDGSDHTIREALEKFEDGKNFYKKYPDVSELAINIEGTERNRGQHAAAIVISDNDLRDGSRCSFVLGKDKEPIINWDKFDIEHMGLMKLDVLGLKMLSVLNYCKKLIKEKHGIEINFNNLPLDEKECYKEFSKGNNVGCFQLGSPGLRKFSKQLGIDNFTLLTHATALYRPGTLHSGATEIFIKRKSGIEKIPVQHPIIDKITKDTYGIILYQEQLMLLVHELAGIEWKVVDKIRKDVAKSKGVEALRKYEDQFVEGCLKNKTIREDEARSLWGDLVSFGSYSFNLSHSVTYSVITYWDMWLKLNYPREFICALLTYGTDNDDMKSEYIEEAFRLGIDIRSPKIGKSKSDRWVIIDDILYTPFIEIKGVGEKNAVQFEKLGQGFLESNISPRFSRILYSIGADKDIPLTDEEADRIGQYLGVSLVKDKLFKYKNLFNLLNKNGIFSRLKEMKLNETDEISHLYFGQITELNLKIRKGKDDTYTSASASFKDATGDCKITFSKELYSAFTEEIEHCEDEIIIIKANTSRKAGFVTVENAWFQEDILSGDLNDLCPELAVKTRFFNPDAEDCNDCEHCQNNKHCPTSQGKYNIMIAGETGKSFPWEFWKEIKKYDFSERDFHRTSFIKSSSIDAKSISMKQIDLCGKLMDIEFENLKPFVVLGIGNTAIKFFTGEEGGINSKNGTTEWNDRYKCFVCYCINPAALYYGGNNIDLFRKGIKNFCEKIIELGFFSPE
jgi:DNA polymerase III subunit alpha